MLDIGSKITELRKARKWSQEELAKKVDSSRVMIGNYERNTNTPSIDIILKMAKVFDVSVDYLLGEGKHVSFDKQTLKRLEDIESLDQNTRNTLFNVIDTFLRDAKARVAYA